MKIDNRITHLKNLSKEFNKLLHELNIEIEEKFKNRYFLTSEINGELLLTDNNSLSQTLYTLDYIPNNIQELEKLFKECSF